MIQELSVSRMMLPRTHSFQEGRRSRSGAAKSGSCSSQSDRSERSNNSSFTSQQSYCRDGTTTAHHHSNNNNKNKSVNKKSHKKQDTIDSDFVTYFICRRP
ncbi:uncharacterized protein LOC135225521 [Macrobrachium nipponense]|uniref:uncharacterized protein LOC135225521 n=1 Tax=Macrobrachium nipponense TaxID=159736 RepID=UPI0030C7E4FA